MPETFKILLLIFFLSSVWTSSVILQEKFTSTDYLSYFNRQCSYTDPGCNNHYATLNFQGTTRLRISIFPEDKTFSKGSPTDPRTELRMKENALKPGVQYTTTWNVNIQNYTPGYYFCFLQLFNANAGPGVMLRWENDQYSLWFDDVKTHIILKGSIQEDIDQTSSWRVTTKLENNNNGYAKVERKRSSESSFSTLGEYKGKTQIGADDHYVKIGIYTQHTDVKRLDMYVNDLEIVQD